MSLQWHHCSLITSLDWPEPNICWTWTLSSAHANFNYQLSAFDQHLPQGATEWYSSNSLTCYATWPRYVGGGPPSISPRPMRCPSPSYLPRPSPFPYAFSPPCPSLPLPFLLPIPSFPYLSFPPPFPFPSPASTASLMPLLPPPSLPLPSPLPLGSSSRRKILNCFGWFFHPICAVFPRQHCTGEWSLPCGWTEKYHILFYNDVLNSLCVERFGENFIHVHRCRPHTLQAT